MVTRSKPEWVLSQKVKLSDRFTVELTFGPGGMTCKWEPALPIGKVLTREEVHRYRKARDELASRFAERLGGKTVLIVE